METPTVTVPKFANETEEANWWFEHQDFMLEEFKRASAEGRLAIGLAKRRALEAQATVQLDKEDGQRARAAAERRGMPFTAYVKMIVHEALEKESAA